MTAPDEYGMVVVGNVRYRKEDVPPEPVVAAVVVVVEQPATTDQPANDGTPPASNGEQPPTDPADAGAKGGVLSTETVKSRQPANKSRAAADK